MPKPKGLCKFNHEWLQMDQYKDWLVPVAGDEHEAKCKLCVKSFKIGVGGKHHVDSHQKSVGHMKRVSNMQGSQRIAVMVQGMLT